MALFFGVAIAPGSGEHSPPCLSQAQYDEDDDSGRDGADERPVPRRGEPDPGQPSEDGTDGPPMDRDAPLEPPGCRFNNGRPLELLV
jgi:hypothetical protein